MNGKDKKQSKTLTQIFKREKEQKTVTTRVSKQTNFLVECVNLVTLTNKK